jgi:hypothetical protein
MVKSTIVPTRLAVADWLFKTNIHADNDSWMCTLEELE